MTQFNYCKTTFCRHLLFLVLALSFGFTAQAKDNSITSGRTHQNAFASKSFDR